MCKNTSNIFIFQMNICYCYTRKYSQSLVLKSELLAFASSFYFILTTKNHFLRKRWIFVLER